VVSGSKPRTVTPNLVQRAEFAPSKPNSKPKSANLH